MDWYLCIMDLILNNRDNFKLWVSQKYEAYQVLFTFEESQYDDPSVIAEPTVVSILCSGVNLEDDSKPRIHLNLSIPITVFEYLGLIKRLAEQHAETFECFYGTTEEDSPTIDYTEALKIVKKLAASKNPEIENYVFSIWIPLK